MSKRKRKGKGLPGNGIGPWSQHGAMARATRTPSKREQVQRAERRVRQRGWQAD